MKQVQSKDGTQIAYDLVGSGPTLLFISGAICHRNFMPILDDVKQFSQEFTVINYDRRGRGDSTDTLPYSPEKELEDIEALIDANGGKVHIYGHSSGAILALEAALKFPTKIEKVFVYDLPYVHNEDYKAQYAKVISEVQSFINEKKHSQAVRSFLKGIGMPGFFVFFLPLMPGWKKLKALAPTLAYDMELTKDFPPLGRLEKIKIPTQIAYGQKSPESIKSVSQSIAHVIKNATLTEVPNQDHMINTKILTPILKEFLK